MTHTAPISFSRLTVSTLLLVSLCAVGARAEPAACATDSARVGEALTQIRRSIDPCGQSAEVTEILDKLARCSPAIYRICTSSEIDRNVFDRPAGRPGESPPRTITWNPDLRSELELGCDGDATSPVRRDPAASLLHEIVHAVQDCEGRNPGEYELEAVRIENIYRRAAGLCQRASYGDDRLPPELVRICTLGNCPCSAPPQEARLPIRADGTNSAAAARSGDSQHQRSGDRPE